MKKYLEIKTVHENFDVYPGETILETLTRNDINIRNSCHAGNCGSCKIKVLTGELDQMKVKRIGLTEEEVAEGYILSCITTPKSDIEIVIEPRN